MKYLGVLLIIPVAIIALYSYVKLTSLPVSSDNTVKNFVVNQADGLKIISARLKKNNLIRSQATFYILAYKLKLNNSLQAGMFKLSPSLSTEEVIKKLSTGGNQDYWLKIIEGQRLEELKQQFDPALEGYIFPDSYLIPQDYKEEQITSIISQNFQKKLSEAKVDAVKTTLSDAQLIILASLLEREARSLESKQHVAGILLNRLEINMALQVDATVQYARDTRLKPKIYWTPVTKPDLKIDSPYNTYLNPGLPPGPICNPGYNSLFAAYHPIESDYIYYITGNDNKMHYAKTLDEHNSNIAKYLK